MHNYALFEMKEADARRAFVRARRFASVIVNGTHGPLAAHVPLVLLPCGEGWKLEGHVSRTNPLADAADGAQGLAIFNGADAYVAAGFYPSKKQHGKVAPTWNYQAVHATGQLQTFTGQDALVEHLVRLTDFLEAEEPEPWAVADAPAGFAEKLAAHIVGFSLKIESLESIEKLNQNTRESDRLGVIDGLALRNNPREHPILEKMRQNTPT